MVKKIINLHYFTRTRAAYIQKEGPETIRVRPGPLKNSTDKQHTKSKRKTSDFAGNESTDL